MKVKSFKRIFIPRDVLNNLKPAKTHKMRQMGIFWKYFLSGQKQDMTEQKLIWPDTVSGPWPIVIFSPEQYRDLGGDLE